MLGVFSRNGEDECQPRHTELLGTSQWNHSAGSWQCGAAAWEEGQEGGKELEGFHTEVTVEAEVWMRSPWSVKNRKGTEMGRERGPGKGLIGGWACGRAVGNEDEGRTSQSQVCQHFPMLHRRRVFVYGTVPKPAVGMCPSGEVWRLLDYTCMSNRNRSRPTVILNF